MSIPDFEKTIDDFERSCTVGPPPNIAEFARGAPIALVNELILIDMEYRWKRSDGPDDVLGGRPRLEDYSLLLESFSSSNVTTSLVAEEYRIRKSQGDTVAHQHFMNRFPSLNGLGSAMQNVDKEIELERSAPTMSIPAFDDRAPLPYADYQLLEHIGTGGMGKVYRGKQRSLGRDVAIKALLKSRQDDPLAVEQFLLEAKLLGRLDHPNIVGVQGIGRFPAGGFFLAMEFVNGTSLQVVDREELTTAQILRTCRDIADAIHHAHERDVVHCDLKPSNILLTADHVPKVVDFGLAHLATTFSAGIQGGTESYLAPECDFDSVARPSVDIFGVGAILLFLLTGRPPNVNGQLELPTLQELTRDKTQKVIASVCLQCLQPDPNDRYADTAALVAAFDRSMGSRVS